MCLSTLSSYRSYPCSSSNFISNKYMKTSLYNTIALMITAVFTCTLLMATRKSRGLSSWLPRNVTSNLVTRPPGPARRSWHIGTLEVVSRNEILPNGFHFIKWLILLWIVFVYVPFHQVFSKCHLTFIYFKVFMYIIPQFRSFDPYGSVAKSQSSRRYI